MLPSLWHLVTTRTIQDLWSIIGIEDQVVGRCPLRQMSHGQNIYLFCDFSGLSFLFHLEVWTKHQMMIFLESISVQFLCLNLGLSH